MADTHAAREPPRVAPRLRLMLDGPILPTLLRLAAPNVVMLCVQAAINVLEAYFVGWLGAEALAGVALVFPVVMLMQMMSAGAMGGGVASSIARALGASRRDDAEALVVHALLVALGMAALFSAAALAGGPALYRVMGGTGGALRAALAYSNVIFGGALVVWLFNILGAVVRGSGNMVLPAAVAVAGAALLAVLSPSLILGLGPAPRLGVAGAAVAVLIYYALGTAVLFAYLLSGRSLVGLRLRGIRIRAALFRDILRVGVPAAWNTVQANLTVVFLTGFVGTFGTLAVAGYGVGARLEYLQIPLVFGLGSALVTLVGTNIGAGQLARAKRIAWIGAGLAAGLTEAIGLTAALVPRAWVGMFSDDPSVLAAGQTYLKIVGPAYGFFGLGLALYFASQGAGRLLWPVVGSLMRLVVAATGGWIVVRWLGGGLPALCAVMALALVTFGAIVAGAMRAGAWDER